MNQFLPEEKSRKSRAKFEGYRGVFMGLMYIVISSIIAYQTYNGLLPEGVFNTGQTMTWVLVVLFLLYGVFRIYRGYKVLRSN